ncbi:YdaU family protein [Paracoccus sp. 22332]|uniref:YdaU family protein n=1 Tax=Paracoccus sp. 22332 TaxID=3453913 RepID=UPI003F877681
MSRFNPKASRSKRPCPIWVDAFQRDTQHLEADEVGAYFLILMAMWTRESCDFPDDDSRLARVSRVSVRLWKSRIGPALRPFFQVANATLISKRLREEARYVERQVTQQHDRKTGENLANSLENNDPTLTADISGDEPRHHPSQQPNSSGGGGGSAGDPTGDQRPVVKAEIQSFRERLLVACGADPETGLTGPNGTVLGVKADMEAAAAWQADLGLTEDQILAVIEDAMSRKRDGPPSRLSYFDRPMQREAGRKNKPKLTPIEGGYDVQPTRPGREAAASDALRNALDVAGRMRRPSSKDCF